MQEETRTLETVLSTLEEGVAIFNENDELVSANDTFASLAPGFSSVVKPGLSWDMLLIEFGKRSKSNPFQKLDLHLMTGSKVPESAPLELNGKPWKQVTLTPLADQSFILNVRPIGDSHTLQDTDNEADDILRNVLDAAEANLMMCRVGSGEILYRTPAWVRLFGFAETAKDLYVHLEDRSTFLIDLLATGVVNDFETTLYRDDSSEFPARISARIVEYRNEDAIVSLTQDMTQFYAQRDEILRSKQRLLDASEALDQALALFDENGNFMLANDLYFTMNAAIRDKITVGMANADILLLAEKHNLPPLLAGHLENHSDDNYEVLLDDGRSFTASKRFGQDGGIVMAWRDITAQKLAAEELNRARSMAWQNEKLTALGELLAGVAHELNNPLSVVVGQTLMMREEEHDEATAKRIDKISTAAERCAKIVKTFLAMARQRPINQQNNSLNDVVTSAVDVAAMSSKAEYVEIVVDLAEDLPPIFADEDQLMQVFINLILNAEQALSEQNRANDETGRILIRTSYEPGADSVLASFEDNGPGVPHHLKARIFEPFFTTKDVGEGTGVGLALSHRIISTHAGELEVGDGGLGGAVFHVRLPVAMLEDHSTDVPEVDGAMKALKVLVVEDEMDVAETITEILKMKNISVCHAQSAREALSLFNEDKTFDVVLSDLKMPGMNGLQFMAELKIAHPDLMEKLAFLTGDAMSKDAATISSQSGRPLLEKPVSPTELHALVQEMTT